MVYQLHTILENLRYFHALGENLFYFWLNFFITLDWLTQDDDDWAMITRDFKEVTKNINNRVNGRSETIIENIEGIVNDTGALVTGSPA